MGAPASDKMSGIDELRMCVNAMNGCLEDFLLGTEGKSFTAEEILKIWRMWLASGCDIYPDQWTERQVREALQGKPPQWGYQGPIY